MTKDVHDFFFGGLREFVLDIHEGFLIGATAWLCFGLKGALPVEVQPFIVAIFFIYILLCSLPIIEIPLVFIAKIAIRKPKQAVPTKTGVISELDELADKTAKEIAEKQEDKKEQVQEPIQPKLQPILQAAAKRVRRVVEYVTPYWDKKDDIDLSKADGVKCTKTGIRKKNRKPSYNSARLRIKKPLSHKKRLKVMSPARMRFRYQKACRYNRFSQEKRR